MAVSWSWAATAPGSIHLPLVAEDPDLGLPYARSSGTAHATPQRRRSPSRQALRKMPLRPSPPPAA
eukprot:scaffold8413_cov135-Isochrysis_galbana.AAC.2